LSPACDRAFRSTAVSWPEIRSHHCSFDLSQPPWTLGCVGRARVALLCGGCTQRNVSGWTPVCRDER
jgi:hypothetical protein